MLVLCRCRWELEVLPTGYETSRPLRQVRDEGWCDAHARQMAKVPPRWGIPLERMCLTQRKSICCVGWKSASLMVVGGRGEERNGDGDFGVGMGGSLRAETDCDYGASDSLIGP